MFRSDKTYTNRAIIALVALLCIATVTLLLFAKNRQDALERERRLDSLPDGASIATIESEVGKPFYKTQHGDISFWFYEDSEGYEITLTIRNGKLDKHVFDQPQPTGGPAVE